MDESDHERYLEVWTRCQPVLTAYVASLMGDVHSVDDLMQEVALTCWRNFPDYDPSRPFLPWALGIARNHALKTWRDRPRGLLPLGEDLAETLAAAVEIEAEAQSARTRALRRCLQTLPDGSRQTLRLVYGESMEQQAAADALGMAHGALRTRLTRLRNALRECIERRLRQEVSDG